jgi:hypothetical protein
MAAYYTQCDRARAHLLFFHREFIRGGNDNDTSEGYGSHIGLGVGALHTVRVLRKKGIRAEVFAVDNIDEVRARLETKPTATHVFLEAPWVEPKALQRLIADFPEQHFVTRVHSQVGFLQVEPRAIRLIRQYLDLQEQSLNYNVSGNSRRFCEFVQEGYRSNCLYLPNLYDGARPARKPPEGHHHRLLRIGSFGAIRLLKNHTTAAAAALLIARQRGCDLEFHLSVNREEHGHGVLSAVRNTLGRLPQVKLVEVPWAPWNDFRQIVAGMDLCMQVSSTESFNLVSADAAAEAVPSVVSHAIEWLPEHWKAHIDDVEEVARVGDHLLSSPREGAMGTRHLIRYTKESTQVWLRYLRRNPRP